MRAPATGKGLREAPEDAGQRTQKSLLILCSGPFAATEKEPRLEIIDHESASDRRRRKCCLRLAGPSLSLGCFLLLSFLLLLAIDISFEIEFIDFAQKTCQPTFDTFDISFVIFGVDDVAQIFLPDWFEHLLPRLRLTQLNAAFFGVL
jgi:hypothetical protein